MKHCEPLVNHLESLVKHYETLLKHCETSWNTGHSFYAMILALCAETSALGALTSAIVRSYWRYRHRVFGDIGDCFVDVTAQMCNRVTNHGEWRYGYLFQTWAYWTYLGFSTFFVLLNISFCCIQSLIRYLQVHKRYWHSH